MVLVCAYEADIVAQMDHLYHTVDLFMYRDNVGYAIVLLKFFENESTDDGSLAQHYQHFFFQVFYTDLFASRQRMVGMHQDTDFTGGHRDKLQIFII